MCIRDRSKDGYIKVVSVMQKFFDQGISGNWSYNPENYNNNEVPVSVMAQDLLNTYKYGWKTSYYQNTYDAKKDIDEPSHPIGWKDEVPDTEALVNDILYGAESEEDCDGCKV